MYFPGTALMYLPVIWLHLPYYAATLTAAGLCAGLFYLIVADVLDGALALLAVLILLGQGIFRLDAIMLLSQIPVLLLGLTMTLAWLRWRREKTVGMAGAAGAAARMGRHHPAGGCVLFCNRHRRGDGDGFMEPAGADVVEERGDCCRGGGAVSMPATGV